MAVTRLVQNGKSTGDQHVGLRGVGLSSLGKVPLFIVEIHLHSQLLADLVENLAILERWNAELIATSVKKAADLLEQAKLACEPLLDSRFQHLENAPFRQALLTKPRASKRNYNCNAGLSQCRRLELDTKLIQRA